MENRCALYKKQLMGDLPTRRTFIAIQNNKVASIHE